MPSHRSAIHAIFVSTFQSIPACCRCSRTEAASCRRRGRGSSWGSRGTAARFRRGRRGRWPGTARTPSSPISTQVNTHHPLGLVFNLCRGVERVVRVRVLQFVHSRAVLIALFLTYVVKACGRSPRASTKVKWGRSPTAGRASARTSMTASSGATGG
jgi:hypothetical protein